MFKSKPSGPGCPKCGAALAYYNYQELPVESCPACKGSLAVKDCLERLVQDCDKYLDLIPDAGGSNSGSFRHAACGGHFQQFRVSSESELKIDLCDTCGAVWFDADELEHARHLHEVVEANKALNKQFSWGHAFFTFLTSLPYEYNAKPRHLPVMLFTIITLNILVFILQSALNDFDPVFYPAAPKNAEWVWSIMLSSFAHLDIMHIVMNMCFLYIFGDNVEDALGPPGFALFYLASALFAALVHVALTSTPWIPCQGASGAVCAVMGVYLVYFRRARLVMPFFPLIWIFKKLRKVPAAAFIGLYFTLELLAVLLDLNDGIGHWVHLGGFAFGLIFGLLSYSMVLKRNPYLKILNRQKA